MRKNNLQKITKDDALAICKSKSINLTEELELLYQELKMGNVSIRQASCLVNIAGKHLDAIKTLLLCCAVNSDIPKIKQLEIKVD